MNRPSQFILIPTEKMGVVFSPENNVHLYVSGERYRTKRENDSDISYHLYIISNDEIKVCDWVINLDDNEVYKSKGNIPAALSNKDCLIKKIIATTNPHILMTGDLRFMQITRDKNIGDILQSDIEHCINIYNEKNKIKCWNCGAEKKVLTGMCSACGRFHVDVKETDENLENRKIVAAQQYALKNCQDNMGSLTKVKLAWENGFETAQSLEGNADKKFTLDDMRKAFNEGMLLPNSKIGSSDTVFQQVIQSIYKEQPKSNTVLVEYEEIFPSYQHGRGLYIDDKPKLDKDGNIVIVRK